MTRPNLKQYALTHCSQCLVSGGGGKGHTCWGVALTLSSLLSLSCCCSLSSLLLLSNSMLSLVFELLSVEYSLSYSGSPGSAHNLTVRIWWVITRKYGFTKCWVRFQYISIVQLITWKYGTISRQVGICWGQFYQWSVVQTSASHVPFLVKLYRSLGGIFGHPAYCVQHVGCHVEEVTQFPLLICT